MREGHEPGRVILIHGASSSGKTTLSRALQQAIEARQDFQGIREPAEYDLELDSTKPLDENVLELISSWKSRGRPTAFEKMAAASGRRSPASSL